jgi:hypothetical protein
MAVRSIEELKASFARHGVQTVYVKRLAPNQDNEKNQIYLGSGLDGVTNLFSAEIAARSESASTRKRKSSIGRPKVEALIRLAWMDDDGSTAPAPNARIIDYFQYPEVRLSGFLSGCERAPDALRRGRQDLYGQRILLLGPAPDGTVIGRVLTARDDPLVSVFPQLPVLPSAPVFLVLPVPGAIGSTPAQLLTAALKSIVRQWHKSQLLKPGMASPIPFNGPQGAGYTLEALLGVSANAIKGPDFQGYEIKTYAGDRITLMTPAPDGGYQGAHPFRDFMKAFGKPARKEDGSLRFTGMYRCGDTRGGRDMQLVLKGYDPATDKFGPAETISVDLIKLSDGVIVASWSFERLANSWNKKHAAAAYLAYERRPSQDARHGFEYRYAPGALIGEGTDVWRLLRAIYKGLVFYDPAHTIYVDGTPKVRPQWRVNASALSDAMGELYAKVSTLKL